ncbi:hypothetical protein [Halomonas sp. KM-1]|uniref:hypothetical protein n=1 Tax=Halomonas sp. KM-1 TaxID=590061 RepID=UPI0002EEFE37|nr:hypothetical protein [Halomonas sp. KM-1]
MSIVHGGRTLLRNIIVNFVVKLLKSSRLGKRKKKRAASVIAKILAGRTTNFLIAKKLGKAKKYYYSKFFLFSYVDSNIKQEIYHTEAILLLSKVLRKKFHYAESENYLNQCQPSSHKEEINILREKFALYRHWARYKTYKVRKDKGNDSDASMCRVWAGVAITGLELFEKDIKFAFKNKKDIVAAHITALEMMRNKHETKDLRNNLIRGFVGKLCCARNNEEECQSLYSWISKAIDENEPSESKHYFNEIELKLCSSEGWSNLSALLWCLALFESSLCARRKSIECAFVEASETESVITLYRGLLASMDLDDTFKAEAIYKKLLEIVNNDVQESGIIKEIGFEKYKATIEHVESLLFRSSAKVENINFLDYIENKKIAIVGSSSGELPDELKKFDIVIELNVVNEKLTGKFEKILSLSHSPAKHFDFSSFSQSARGCKWIMVPEKYVDFFEGRGVNIFAKGASPHLYSGSLNHGMSVIYYLLKYKPSKIKIFNMNFYLSSSIYRDGYSPFDLKMKDLSLTTILLQANHDSFSNINFTKSLLNRNLVCADNGCKHVLNMELEQYAGEMKKIVLSLG